MFVDQRGLRFVIVAGTEENPGEDLGFKMSLEKAEAHIRELMEAEDEIEDDDDDDDDDDKFTVSVQGKPTPIPFNRSRRLYADYARRETNKGKQPAPYKFTFMQEAEREWALFCKENKYSMASAHPLHLLHFMHECGLITSATPTDE